MSFPEVTSSAQSAIDPASLTSLRRSSRDGVTSGLVETEHIPSVSSSATASRYAGGRSKLAQLVSWLMLRGFHTNTKLPAAFEVDILWQGNISGSNSDSSKSTGAPSVCDTMEGGHREGSVPDRTAHVQTIKHEQQYVCGLRHDIFQHLIEDVRRLLHDSYDADGKVRGGSTTEKANDDLPTAAVYILQDAELARIVARVVRVLETLHHASIISLRDQGSHGRAPERKSITPSTAILPQAPKKPDTATTITLPHTYITPAGLDEQSMALDIWPERYEEPTTNTTLVSHSAVTGTTEISWTTRDGITSTSKADDDSYARHAPSDPRSSSVGDADNVLTATTGEGKPRASVGSITSWARGTPASRRVSAAERAHVVSYPPAQPSLDGSEGSIVSFPALRVRHCTNDWLIPPAATPVAMGRNDANLYNAGIDAHTGSDGLFSAPSASRKSVVESAPPVTNLNFTLPDFTTGHRNATLWPDSHTHDKLGTSIGMSAGRKRSSHHAMSPDTESGSSSMLQKLRQSSAQIGHALASAVAGSSHVHEPVQAEQGRRTSSVGRMKAILDRSLPQPSPTPMMGNSRVGMVLSGDARRRACDTCSEDSRPHMCMDEGASSVGST